MLKQVKQIFVYNCLVLFWYSLKLKDKNMHWIYCVVESNARIHPDSSNIKQSHLNINSDYNFILFK